MAAIIKGTKASVVGDALKQVPVSTRYAVKEITADLASTMDWICRDNFLGARLTADRFHVQQLVSEGVQEIRIKLRREAMDEENESIAQAKTEQSEDNRDVLQIITSYSLKVTQEGNVVAHYAIIFDFRF